MDSDRKEKFGIICRVAIDHDDPQESVSHRTKVYRKDRTPNKPDYRDLMKNGGQGWRREHSERGLLEWGTPTDYLGDGERLMLFDTDSREITVVAEIEPDKYYLEDNYYKFRNIIKEGYLKVLKKPVPLEEIKKVNDLDKFQNYRLFKDITEEQYEAILEISDKVY
ncbi:MAG: EVE domain-containing protein [Candidatus Thermoplasmatota archaeon]|jgi:hypothetical protein|nr:EVE domain-containing protein [Candidatus Thermoplasmatota archaeon]MDA8143440.1 hypothetical protein [Thermoplasmatales archaeon]